MTRRTEAEAALAGLARGLVERGYASKDVAAALRAVAKTLTKKNEPQHLEAPELETREDV